MKSSGVIFLLENSTDYLFNLDQALRCAQVLNPLRVARYGNEAILYLKGIGIYGDRNHCPLPSLIFLDLSTPDGSGLAVLGWIRRQPEFSAIPVIILVQPEQTKYLQEAFERGANAYYVKRNDLAMLAQTIKSLELMGDLDFSARNSASPKYSREQPTQAAAGFVAPAIAGSRRAGFAAGVLKLLQYFNGSRHRPIKTS